MSWHEQRGKIVGKEQERTWSLKRTVQLRISIMIARIEMGERNDGRFIIWLYALLYGITWRGAGGTTQQASVRRGTGHTATGKGAAAIIGTARHCCALCSTG
jgi:hypothetical protein